ncbi:MAG TPA: recombinase family protein [Kofleriaceae bacterium]
MTRRAPKPAATSETKRCAVYTRKSTSVGLDQDFNSLDAQREACVAYIQRQAGWTLVDTAYDDGGFTGANIDRPAFQRLLADIDAGRVDVVVVYKVDRLSRSLLDFAKVMERFNAAGASFVSVTQNFSTADAMGRLTLNMLMSFAEFEREMISERTRDKIAGARRKGKWTGGPVPLGYTVVDKKLVVDELEAVLVREIFALYHDHRSALAVTRALNARRESIKRRRAAIERGRALRTWTKTDVLRVLKNPVYAGYMAADDRLYDAEHTALIERTVFARTRALLAAATRTKKAAVRNPEYLLRGVLRCARCGAGFTAASTIRGRVTHRYYRCVTRDKQGKEACPSAPLPAGAIEAFVIAQLREVTADGALAADITAAVRARAAARRKDLLIERGKLPAQIAALSLEVSRAVDALGSVTGPARRPVETRLQGVGEQLARAEARLAVAERELAQLDAIEVEASWVADCLAEFHQIWDVLTPENRGRLLRAVIQRVEVDEPANQIKVFVADLATEVPEASSARELAHEAAP